ncbi:hypothetical protein A3D09_02815 [Candidatus Collierbacteria bacterium RIFCSPHIGHO2_02_FULL_49_10]|uniref:Cell division protein FtsL n=1 Tax=Candidatus Collierbacteria bacterium RIFCSPHIGHO2_02_FULL_49_10 TaxID=1817723 RepID=A0A1F5EWE0_9BACT|nr:MAG: hypothetical protein A3D09_02815 [Candidatus Collierbacteria bacterium RIFCSPHIGHO2_02_FULL_49_10]
MIQAKRAYVKEGRGGGAWPKYLLLVSGFYLVWTLSKGIWELRTANLRIDEARQILAREQAKAEQLKRKWTEVQTADYLEKVARNDLNMQKEGETIVVLPSNQPASAESYGEAKEEKELKNWEKWWNLVK